ncbi:Oidioi.mRNA.OKI2018_I69.chr1.g2909.t1.cds [Oikopleura dioica]|uniref:Oidioi.mRNA.OKI2018_I69.chr1.g2909.t1.cds n=1 Tax=Oikopleura dioica TaxID=34765 RepID=A0ABN7SWV8_OIKDI|nr:Oidioi.mRNA.OKI2018_I69.chr1.g2909.t1.cds [Oikopleura dioica]
MVNFSFLGSRNAQLLKSQRIADQICKEIVGFIGSIFLILMSMSGCYLMLRMVARRASESTTNVNFPVSMMMQTTRQMECIQSPFSSPCASFTYENVLSFLNKTTADNDECRSASIFTWPDCLN